MPVVGFECAARRKRDNRGKVGFAGCLSCAETNTDRCHYSYPILNGIIENLQDRDYISVTSLLGCLRNTYLSMTYDYFASPDDLYHMFRGSISHLITEKYSHPDAIVEETFTKEHDGIEVSGTPDVIIPDQELIRDFKTTKSVPFFKYPYSNHTMQLNLYRWLVPYETNHLEVQYLDMGKVKRSQAKIHPDRTQEILDTRLTTLKSALDMEQPPPKPAPDSEDRWQCNGYCNVADICERLWIEEIKKDAVEDLKLRW